MTKPVIVKRNTKGSHLTFTELDANFQNLQDATISLQGGTGGVSVVSDLNGTITLVNSDEITFTGDNTAKTITVSEKIQRVYVYVHNAQGAIINKGEPVYLYQATGDKPSVKLAQNTGDSTSAKTLGLAAETLAIGGEGYVITQGSLVGVNTAAYNEGDTLYLGATAGSLTATKPYAPNHLVYIGVVEKANAGQGEIYVKPQNGYELEELHNVNIDHNVALADGHTLIYNSSNQLWENGEIIPAVDLITDTSPQLGGDLDVNGYKIRSSSSGNIILEGNPNTTGEIRLVTRTTVVGVSSDIARITSAATTPLEITAAGNLYVGGGGNYAAIRIGQGTMDSLNLYSSSTGSIILDNQAWPKTDGTNGQVLSTNGSGGLSWTNGLTNATAGYVALTDRSGSQTSYASSATVDFTNFSGMVMVNRADTGSGNVALWLCGGGAALKLGDSTGTANSGTITYVSGISGYRWTNDTGGTINCSFTAFKGRNAG